MKNCSLGRGGAMWVDERFTAWKRGVYVPRALSRAIEDLEAYYRRPVEHIARGYWEARDRAEGTAAPASDTALTALYGDTGQYVYESTYFEAFAEYQWYFEIVRRACHRFQRAPVLDFGGGAGGMTLALAAAGIACDYADVPGTTSDYARWRLARHGLSCRVLDATAPLPEESYQAIVTLDVFEHLPDLPGTVRALSRALAPGGWLITKSTFAAGDPLHLPQNLIYADFPVFDRLMAACGLRYRGRLRPDPLSELRFRWGRPPRVWWIRLDPKPKFGGRFLVHQRCQGWR